jgi:hypothetical protein
MAAQREVEEMAMSSEAPRLTPLQSGEFAALPPDEDV